MSDNLYEQNEAIINYEQGLKNEQTKNNKLVGDLEALSNLYEEFKSNPTILNKVKGLDYRSYRKIVRDGNCFFRAFIYCLFERLITASNSNNEFVDILKNSKNWLSSAGVDEFILQDFYDQVDVLIKNKNSFRETLNNIELSNGIIFYFRLIVSNFLRQNREEFEPFLMDYNSLDEYCCKEVEVLDRESDQIHIICLSRFFKVKVAVVYLDSGVNDTKPNIHYFPNSEAETDVATIHLLYRPGHYDIIYQ